MEVKGSADRNLTVEEKVSMANACLKVMFIRKMCGATTDLKTEFNTDDLHHQIDLLNRELEQWGSNRTLSFFPELEMTDETQTTEHSSTDETLSEERCVPDSEGFDVRQIFDDIPEEFTDLSQKLSSCGNTEVSTDTPLRKRKEKVSDLEIELLNLRDENADLDTQLNSMMAKRNLYREKTDLSHPVGLNPKSLYKIVQTRNLLLRIVEGLDHSAIVCRVRTVGPGSEVSEYTPWIEIPSYKKAHDLQRCLQYYKKYCKDDEHEGRLYIRADMRQSMTNAAVIVQEIINNAHVNKGFLPCSGQYQKILDGMIALHQRVIHELNPPETEEDAEKNENLMLQEQLKTLTQLKTSLSDI